LKKSISSSVSLVLFLGFLFANISAYGQEEGQEVQFQVVDGPDGTPRDTTIVYKQKYGLRVGVDISRPLTSFFRDRYTGLELVGDYRLSENLFVAAELGNEKLSQTESLRVASPDNPDQIIDLDLYDYTTSGSYIKLGVDYNTYGNWFGEQNFITIGGRYAFASFSQTLNSFSLYETDQYFNPNTFSGGSDQPQEFSGLTASWLELVVGYKFEAFNNIYMGMSARLGFLVSNSESDVFPNLWIPGFNKVTDNSRWGVGYNYSISYFLPLYKKARKKREPALTENP